MERPCEATARRWPSVSQEESSRQKPGLVESWSQTPSLRSCENIHFCCWGRPISGIRYAAWANSSTKGTPEHSAQCPCFTKFIPCSWCEHELRPAWAPRALRLSLLGSSCDTCQRLGGGARRQLSEPTPPPGCSPQSLAASASFSSGLFLLNAKTSGSAWGSSPGTEAWKLPPGRNLEHLSLALLASLFSILCSLLSEVQKHLFDIFSMVF